MVKVGFDNGFNGDGYGLMVGSNPTIQGNQLLGIGGMIFTSSGHTFTNINTWYHPTTLRRDGTTRFYVNGVQTSQTVPFPAGAKLQVSQ